MEIFDNKKEKFERIKNLIIENKNKKNKSQPILVILENIEETIDFVRKAFLGEIYYNLTYADGTVENTFKLNGKNYREEIGEVNGNKDYESNSFY